jgi:hypothetical protein
VWLPILGLPSDAAGEPVSFNYTKIVDTADDPRWFSFSMAALDGDVIAFIASGARGESVGVYAHVGGRTRLVVDTATQIPGGSGKFSGFSDLALGGYSVAFVAGKNFPFDKGIYIKRGSVLSVVADENTVAPNGAGKFIDFGGVSTDGRNVAFYGHARGRRRLHRTGIYLSNGSRLSVVADNGMPVPGSAANFLSFDKSDIDVDEGKVVFTGQAEGPGFLNGIYLYDSHRRGLSVVADTNTPIPGGSGNFSRLSSPAIEEGAVVFWGAGEGDPQERGIYMLLGGSLRVIADTTTAVPGRQASFRTLAGSAVSGDHVMFTGFERLEPPGGDSIGGIYASRGGSLKKVIAIGDSFEGNRVRLLSSVFNDSMSADSVAFTAWFTEGRPGIFRADAALPVCPTATALAGHGGRSNIQRDLYRLRDKVLDRSKDGQYITRLFYRNADEIRDLMERDPDLKARTQDALAALAPRIAVVVEGGVAHLSGQELRQIETLMDDYAARGSFRLRVSLWWLRYGVPYRTHLRSFGFRVAG